MRYLLFIAFLGFFFWLGFGEAQAAKHCIKEIGNKYYCETLSDSGTSCTSGYGAPEAGPCPTIHCKDPKNIANCTEFKTNSSGSSCPYAGFSTWVSGTCPKKYYCINPSDFSCQDISIGGYCNWSSAKTMVGECPKYYCKCIGKDKKVTCTDNGTKKTCATGCTAIPASYKATDKDCVVASTPATPKPKKDTSTKYELESIRDSGKTEFNQAGFKSPENILAKIIKLSLQAVGVATLGLYIYGGALYMVSGGNAEQQGKAIKILVWTTLGVVVIAGSYMFVNYIFTKIIK